MPQLKRYRGLTFHWTTWTSLNVWIFVCVTIAYLDVIDIYHEQYKLLIYHKQYNLRVISCNYVYALHFYTIKDIFFFEIIARNTMSFPACASLKKLSCYRLYLRRVKLNASQIVDFRHFPSRGYHVKIRYINWVKSFSANGPLLDCFVIQDRFLLL